MREGKEERQKASGERRREEEEGIRLEARLGPEAGEQAWRYEDRLAGCQRDQCTGKQLIAWIVDMTPRGEEGMRQWTSY